MSEVSSSRLSFLVNRFSKYCCLLTNIGGFYIILFIVPRTLFCVSLCQMQYLQFTSFWKILMGGSYCSIVFLVTGGTTVNFNSEDLSLTVFREEGTQQ